MNNSKYSFIIQEKEKEKSSEQEIEDYKIFLKKLQHRNKISYLIISITFGISSLADLAVQFYFKDVLGVGPSDLAQIVCITMIPWFIKPFFGLLTDLLPVCGYRRKFYIILCGLLDFLCWILIAFVVEGIGGFVCLLFLHNSCLSFTTVLGEAIVVELSKVNEEGAEHLNQSEHNAQKTSQAKNYVSYFFFFKYLGSLFSSVFKGILVKKYTLKTVFFISSFIPLFFVVSGLILLEEPIEKVIIDQRELIRSRMSGRSIQVQTAEDSCPGKFFGFLFQRHILIPILFTVIFVGTPSYSDPMFFFFTETLKLDSIDLGIISLFSTLATLVAIALYRFCFKNKSFRSVITVGSIFAFVISFSAYLLVMRYNLKLGIPDFPFIIFSYSFITMLGELVAMPLLSLAAVLSPKNLEGTSYSVFMSAINFGAILSNLLGAFLTSWLNITKKDFTNLPDLILVANFVSLLPLPFLFCMKNSYFDPQEPRIKEGHAILTDKGLVDGTGGNEAKSDQISVV